MKTYIERYMELSVDAITCIKDYMIQYHDIPLNLKNYDRIYWDGSAVIVNRPNVQEGEKSKPLNELNAFEIFIIADSILKTPPNH